MNNFKTAFAIVLEVLSGMGFVLLGNLQAMLRDWSSPQIWDAETIKIASALTPLMPVLILFNLILSLLALYLLAEAVREKR